jgi:hypothetical protein
MTYSVGLGDVLRRINRTAVTVAIGIVFMATLIGSFVIGLMGLVETAHCKRAGRDSCRVYSAGQTEHVTERPVPESKLRAESS